jgi:hypothetical protein
MSVTRTPGFDFETTKETGEPGAYRRRPSEEKDVPRESLAARIAKAHGPIHRDKSVPSDEENTAFGESTRKDG